LRVFFSMTVHSWARPFRLEMRRENEIINLYGFT
jgi:hypothetical protein